MPLANSLEGGCICGQLRYHVSDLPLVVLACHCNNCKHRSGAAFSLSMLTLQKDFEKTLGRNDYLRLARWKRGNASAARVSELLDPNPYRIAGASRGHQCTAGHARYTGRCRSHSPNLDQSRAAMGFASEYPAL
jgi:hypothetical protein